MDSTGWLLLLGAQALLFGGVCAGIWRSKGGDAGQGFFFGLVLSALGLAFVAFAVPSPREKEPGELTSGDLTLIGATTITCLAVLLAVIASAP